MIQIYKPWAVATCEGSGASRNREGQLGILREDDFELISAAQIVAVSVGFQITDEELKKMLERRETRWRIELESQKQNREYYRKVKRSQLQTKRIMTRFSIGMIWLLLAIIISTCTAEKEAGRQIELLDQRMRTLAQKDR